MKRTLALLSLALAPLATLSLAAAQSNLLNVATGAEGGTYATMYKNLGQVCTSASWLKERHTSGSIENVDLLLGNQVSLAFVQVDVLKAREQIDGDPRTKEVRALLPLHHEEVHVIAPKPSKTSGVFGLGAKTVGVRKFSELAGKRVGAWGGSVVTARVLGAQGGVKYDVVSFGNRDAALAALNSQQVDAVLAVVGQPAEWVEKLDPNKYNLLPVDLAKLPAFYSPAKLIYTSFGGAVPTVSVQSILATRNFKTPDKRKQLLDYQKCARNKLTDLQESEGMHPKWQDVSFDSFPWPAYQ